MTTLSVNKKASFDYEILEKYEAGLVLTGPEVKSIRTGSISLKEGYITFHNNGAWLINVHIPKYKFSGSIKDYEPDKSRRLLLKRKEIIYLKGKSAENGLTIVPLSLYTKGRRLKLEIAVVKGKKKYDKRASIKKKDIIREMARRIKG